MQWDDVPPVDPLDFILAEALGKSLGEIRALPNAEIVQWRAFFHWRKEMVALRG